MAADRSNVAPGQVPALIRQILVKRGYQTDEVRRAFLNPDYLATNHDAKLLHDMAPAVERLLQARDHRDKVTIYCDYDVDGTTAAALLMDALPKFGIEVDYYVPDRFAEGYGMNKSAIEKIVKTGTRVILTVDNGIVSFDEANYAKELGVDLIITDHHTPRDKLPEAIAVVNPKIPSDYPFTELCGCGVAFKLVQALQSATVDHNQTIPAGQEKWLLDLVALATIADVVPLVDENRSIAKWGLEVVKKTRRPGLRALVAAAGVELNEIDARTVGFVLGPRLNAAGRLANARIAIELLTAQDGLSALEIAEQLNELNAQRKQLQNDIYASAISQVDARDPVAIAIGDDWHEGVIGIVASKVQEAVEKPTFVFSRHDGMAKASGRSFGDFSIAAAINATSTLLEKGGGHAAAGGVSVRVDGLTDWCRAVNNYYRSLHLENQRRYLYPEPDVSVTKLAELSVELVESLALLEPCGASNPVPTFELHNVRVVNRRLMGSDLQHVSYTFADDDGCQLRVVAFNAADRFVLAPGEFGEVVRANVLVELTLNEWNGSITVQGKLIKIDEA